MGDRTSQLQEDPLYRNSLREARFILSLWFFCFVYTVSYCYLHGYLSHEPLPNSVGSAIGSWFGPLEAFNRDPESLTYPLGLGIPDWVFYGVVVPWGISIVLTLWYVCFFFADDDLSAPDERDSDAAGGESEA